jgi:predicted restriction endonuclease
LVASHIVSWATCKSNAERLDLNNGLLLSPNLDKLFDRKVISFSNNGVLQLNRKFNWNDVAPFGVHPDMRLRDVPGGIVKYLKRHRDGTLWSDAV